MKKILPILLIMILLISVFSVFALALDAEPLPLRAGGGGGGGGSGGGGGGRLFGHHLDDPIFDALYIIFASLISIWGTIKGIRFAIKRKKSIKKTDKTMDRLGSFDSGWSRENIDKQVKSTYFAVQKAWSKGNMRNVRHLMDEALFEEFQHKLKIMKSQQTLNKLANIELLEAYPVSAIDEIGTENDSVWYYIKGKMIDYMYDTHENRRLDDDLEAKEFVEYWKFVRTDYQHWVLAQIAQANEADKLGFDWFEKKEK